MAIYRQGREEDLPEIVELLRGLVAESVYGGDPRFEFQEDDMRAHVKRFMDLAPRTLCAVCEDDGLCGVILADYCTMGFNRSVRSARENMLCPNHAAAPMTNSNTHPMVSLGMRQA